MARLLVFLLVVCISSASGVLKGKLMFSHILFRHGDRTPIDPYPNDPWNNLDYWPTGWGQLTNIGKMQHYELGKWLKQRYRTVINESYSKDEIYIQSTDVDRSLMSALSNLAGLYSPKAKQIWNKNIAWQPIPVHTTPEKDDGVLSTKKPCPAYDYAVSELRQSDYFQKLDKRFNYLYNYLTKYTGKKINSFEGVQKINNTLFIEDLYNKSLPEWTKKVFPGGDMNFVTELAFATSTYTRKLARLRTGPLLKDILMRFKKKFTSTLKPDRSLWIYSAHDTTVANLLNILNLFEYHSPPYTACILLELRVYNGRPLISVFYKNSSAEPLPLNIPNCGIQCSLDDMFSLYNDVLPIDWSAECRLSMLSMTYEEADVGYAMGILIVIASALLVTILIYLLTVYYRRKSYFDYRWYVQID